MWAGEPRETEVRRSREESPAQHPDEGNPEVPRVGPAPVPRAHGDHLHQRRVHDDERAHQGRAPEPSGPGSELGGHLTRREDDQRPDERHQRGYVAQAQVPVGRVRVVPIQRNAALLAEVGGDTEHAVLRGERAPRGRARHGPQREEDDGDAQDLEQRERHADSVAHGARVGTPQLQGHRCTSTVRWATSTWSLMTLR